MQAVLRAAAVLRGEAVPPIEGEGAIPAPPGLFEPPPGDGDRAEPPALLGGPRRRLPMVKTTPMPTIVVAPEVEALEHVGKPEAKVDALKLVQGKPAFTADMEMRGMLVGKMLWSPFAHARIKRIDASRARVLPGVHAVLTHEDVPGRNRHGIVIHDWPVLCETKVRYLGDAVALVAAESPEVAREALSYSDELYSTTEQEIIARLGAEVEIIRLSPSVREQMRARTRPVYDFFVKRGDYTWGDINAAIAASRSCGRR